MKMQGSSMNGIRVVIWSRKDETYRDDMEEEYNELSILIKDTKIKLFDFGNPPLILSDAIEVSKLLIKEMKLV